MNFEQFIDVDTNYLLAAAVRDDVQNAVATLEDEEAAAWVAWSLGLRPSTSEMVVRMAKEIMEENAERKEQAPG